VGFLGRLGEGHGRHEIPLQASRCTSWSQESAIAVTTSSKKNAGCQHVQAEYILSKMPNGILGANGKCNYLKEQFHSERFYWWWRIENTGEEKAGK
jgi:hypothetical protein